MRMPLQRLTSGMKLSRELKHNGMVLLNTDTVLTAPLIETIKKRNIAFVDVDVADTTSVPGDIGSPSTLDNVDPEYLKERSEIDALFATVSAEDKQLSMLKYCITSQLQEKYSDERR